MEIEIVVHTYTEIFNNTKALITDTCNKMDESQRHYVKWKKTDTKSIYHIIAFIQNSREGRPVVTENSSVVAKCQQYRTFWDNGNVLYHDCGDSYITIYLTKLLKLYILSWQFFWMYIILQ